MRLSIRVQPNARRAKVGGTWDGPDGQALVVAVSAPAVDGKANAAVVNAVAQAFGLRASAVTIVHGERGRQKVLDVQLGDAEFAQRLAILMGGD